MKRAAQLEKGGLGHEEQREVWRAFFQREATDSEFLKTVREILGKSDKEANAMLDKYAEWMEKTCLLREYLLKTK